MKFPLSIPPLADYHTGGRRFGSDRPGGRLHAGCDLIAQPGTPVRAVAKGKIRIVAYPFVSGEDDIWALEVTHEDDDGGTFTVRYGEVSPDSVRHWKAGAVVNEGQEIARVGRFKSGSSMLHFEYYVPAVPAGKSLTGDPPFKRHMHLKDPTSFLDELLADTALAVAMNGHPAPSPSPAKTG